MAEFIVGNSLRKIARKHEFLRQALWRLDFALVWVVVNLSKLLPSDLCARFGQRGGGWIGPRLSATLGLCPHQNAPAASTKLLPAGSKGSSCSRTSTIPTTRKQSFGAATPSAFSASA